MVNNSEEYGGASWTATPTLNTARGQDAGFGITTAAVCYFGGATPTGTGGYTEEYNGSSWTTGNSMSTNRYEFGATGILTAALALQGDPGPSTPFGVTHVKNMTGLIGRLVEQLALLEEQTVELELKQLQ